MQRSDGVRPIEVKKRIQKLMWDHVGLVRSGPKMEQTLRQFGEIRAQVLPALKVNAKSRILNREWMEAIELENLLDIAEAMAGSSLLRKETRGAHYRTDYPNLDPLWTANVWVKRPGSRLAIEKRAVAGPEAAHSAAVPQSVVA